MNVTPIRKYWRGRKKKRKNIEEMGTNIQKKVSSMISRELRISAANKKKKRSRMSKVLANKILKRSNA